MVLSEAQRLEPQLSLSCLVASQGLGSEPHATPEAQALGAKLRSSHFAPWEVGTHKGDHKSQDWDTGLPVASQSPVCLPRDTHPCGPFPWTGAFLLAFESVLVVCTPPGDAEA